MPPQGQNQNPYEFFLNPAPAPKKNIFSGFSQGGSSFSQRLFLIIAGGIVLVIIIVIFSSLLSSSGLNTTSLITIGKDQNQLINISTTAAITATQQLTLNLAVNIEFGLTTDLQQLTAYAKNHSFTLPAKQLVPLPNPTINQELSAAQAASNYDIVYLQVMQKLLSVYTSDLSYAYNKTSLSSQKQLLKTDYQHANILIAQTNSALSNLQSQ
jgi:hypothetical protein